MKIRGYNDFQDSLYAFSQTRNSISSLSKEDLQLAPTRLVGELTKIAHLDATNVIGSLDNSISFSVFDLKTGL